MRRKLRKLTMKDRELFLDTCVALYKTATKEGVAL